MTPTHADPLAIARHWLPDASLSTLRHACPAGSPERAVARHVVQDAHGQAYVLEGVRPEKAHARNLQAQTLQALADAGCHALAPWLPLPNGDFLLPHADGLLWQLRPFVPGSPLPRRSYGDDAWRGQALARFLADCSRAASSLNLPWTRFLTRAYITRIMPLFAQRLPPLADDLKPIVAELRDFLDAEPTLPTAFAHGDFHPLNVLWTDHGISAVIDWEFLGLKTAAYDAANLLGCLGNDSPAWLTGPCATAFVANWAADAHITPETLHFLPDLIAAVRFGWMREWCVRQQRDMIVQELDFIWLVLDNRQLLRDRWRDAAATRTAPHAP